MRYCPHCGERVDARDTYCFECGTALDGPGTESGRDTDERRSEPAAGPPEPRPDRERPRDGGATGRPAGDDRVASLTTVWVAGGLSVMAILESLGTVLFADAVLEQAEEFGVADGMSADVIVAQAVLGLALALVVAGVCVYYYRKGYVDRRFFWSLVGFGVFGFLFGGGLAGIGLVVLGAYGLLSVLRGEQSGDRATRGVR